MEQILHMTTRLKFRGKSSGQLLSVPSSPLSNQQKQRSRRQRRRMRKRFRPKRRHVKTRNRSMHMATQIVSDALDKLHISTESNAKSFEFIEQYEITRLDALSMLHNERTDMFLTEHNCIQAYSTKTSKMHKLTDENGESSYA